MGIKNLFGFVETDKDENPDSLEESMQNMTSGVSRVGSDLESMSEPEPAFSGQSTELDHDGADVAQKVYSGSEILNTVNEFSDSSESEALEKEEEKGVSMISKEASVQGNIITEGHLDVVGKVTGDISAKGNVAIQGAVTGNITGEKIGLYECKINGNLTADTGVVADSGSTIVGDVMTKNLIMDGKLKGDVTASNVVVLRNNAYFIGDVATASLAVEAGAVINGNVKMLVDGDPEVPFER